MALKLEAPVKPAELIEDYRHGFHDEEKYVFKSDKGLTREIVERISSMKDEPAWMREFRLKAYEIFLSKPMPTWGDTARLSEIDFVEHPLLREVDRQDRAVVGRRARGYQADVRSPWHPRGRAQVSLRRLRAVRVRSRLPQYDARRSTSRACSSATWTPRSRSIPRSFRSISRR